MDHGLAAHALSTKSPKKTPAKHMKEVRVKQLHSGGYSVSKHSGNPEDQPTEHGAPDMNAASQLMQDHMGEQAEPAEAD